MKNLLLLLGVKFIGLTYVVHICVYVYIDQNNPFILEMHPKRVFMALRAL